MNRYVLDWGNTRLKLGHFENQRLKKNWVFSSIKDAANFVNDSNCKHLFVSTVNDDHQSFRELLNKNVGLTFLDENTPLPFTNNYNTKATLGKDRIAAVAGAQVLYNGNACLVIDAGTCITLDYLDGEGNYWGGVITPGVKIRREGMHYFTKRLPLLTTVEEFPALIGSSTTACMASGIVNGAIEEINGFVDRFRKEKGSMNVILCGGDAKFFESSIKAPIFVVPELVLIGLNAILEYNEI
jgi:type III pantothenate kinase